ncbi:hypothetical protein TNCV_4161211 [Trichonephila clavipes]|nr:hypothetical protein TNCV_4161211 [Trichonephila clavipes]
MKKNGEFHDEELEERRISSFIRFITTVDLISPISFDDEDVPPVEDYISSDGDTVSNFPVQCISRKNTSWKKKQCVNKRKKSSDSNPDEMILRTFVINDGMCWKNITSLEDVCAWKKY